MVDFFKSVVVNHLVACVTVTAFTTAIMLPPPVYGLDLNQINFGIKTLSLLVKNIPRSHDYLPDYTLFTIENRFVIGYGLDYKELYRGLPGIYAFINDTPPF